MYYLFFVNPIYLTNIINDIVNNKTSAENFSENIVIMLYKGKKKGKVSDCNSFRSIQLSECLEKLAQKCFLMKHKIIIEEAMGPSQFGYKEKKGANSALEELHKIIIKRKGKATIILKGRIAVKQKKKRETVITGKP